MLWSEIVDVSFLWHEWRVSICVSSESESGEHVESIDGQHSSSSHNNITISTTPDQTADCHHPARLQTPQFDTYSLTESQIFPKSNLTVRTPIQRCEYDKTSHLNWRSQVEFVSYNRILMKSNHDTHKQNIPWTLPCLDYIWTSTMIPSLPLTFNQYTIKHLMFSSISVFSAENRNFPINH